MVVSTVSAAFAPAVPPHSGCFIQKTWTSSPCLTPVCFHSASVSKLLPSSYGGAAEIQRKPMWTVLTLMCLFLCLSPLFFFMSFFFSTGMSEGGLYFEAVYYWCQACDVLYKMRICCSKLPGEFTREPCVKRKALFSYPVGPNSCFVVLICGTEGPEALFNGLAAVRTFSLFSNDHTEPLLHPIRERLQIYTGSPVLGKPLTKPPPMAVSNCHYYCIR